MLVTPPLYGGICGVLYWQWNGQPFSRTLATKITDAGKICGALHEAQNIKRMCWCILLILSLDAPGMSSNHRGRRPGARRSEDAMRQSAFSPTTAVPAPLRTFWDLSH